MPNPTKEQLDAMRPQELAHLLRAQLTVADQIIWALARQGMTVDIDTLTHQSMSVQQGVFRVPAIIANVSQIIKL